MKLSLRAYVAVIFAIIIIVLTTVLSISIGRQSSEKVETEIGNALSTTAFQMADKLDFFMWSRAGEVDIVSQLKDIKNQEDTEAIQNLLEQLQESFTAFSWVGLTDIDGNVLVATDDILEGANISQRPVFYEALDGNFIGDVHDAVLLSELLPNPTGEPIQFVDISKAITGEDGDTVGVLATHLSWEWARQVEASIIEPLEQKFEGAEIFIVNKNDNAVLLGPDKMVGKPLELESIRRAQQQQENNAIIETWPDGENYLTGYAYGTGYQEYEGLGWTILVRIPEEIAFKPVQELQKSIVLSGIVLTIIFSVVGWYVAGFVTKPLQRITTSARQLRTGEKVEIPFFRGIKDIEILSLTLRELVTSLIQTISELNKMEDLANHDKLTGLPNRIALERIIDDATEKAKETNNTLTFLYIDLDGFKQVNDIHGHDIGDELLQEVAKRITATIDENDYAFRLGGDEFLVILSGKEKQEYAQVAKNIVNNVGNPYQLKSNTITVGSSIGGAIWPDHDDNPTTVISYADQALYESKRTGKNKVTFRSSND
ncbi:sensor domain-containing diguanylate cyclase [Radiobacillus sp. PE A8.2]|uniref:sensor domain-containing diguanylate cyclase n=1 Tax=Radiobacillus sp. PE A8.2 TaxID=3380349 RepID=UPI00389094F7